MALQVENSGASLRLISDGIVTYLTKASIREIRIEERSIVVIDTGERQYNTFLDFTLVTNPVTQTAEELRDAINAMLYESPEVFPKDLAKEAKQDTAISELQKANTSLSNIASKGDSSKKVNTPQGEGDFGEFSLAIRNETLKPVGLSELNYSPFAVDRYGRLLVISGKLFATPVAVANTPTALTYTPGNKMFNSSLEFPSSSKSDGGSFKIFRSRVIVGEAMEIPPDIDLYLFSEMPLEAADNTPFDPSLQLMNGCYGVIEYKGSFLKKGGITNPSILIQAEIKNPITGNSPAGSKNIYGVPVIRNNYTTRGNVSFRFILEVEQN